MLIQSCTKEHRGIVHRFGARGTSALLVLTWSLTAPRAAHAQASAAEALFEQGRTALAANDLDTACARFRASDQIEPAAGTRANLADCEERRGRVATAWELYKSALAKLPPGDSRASVIQERIQKLEARLPKLVLTLAPGAPKDTVVREGDATIGSGATYGVALPLDPGAHHFLVAAPGRAATSVDVKLVEATTTNLAVEPGAPVAVAPPRSAAPSTSPLGPPAAPPAPPATDVEPRSAGPWIVGGVGVAGLLVGAVTGGLVLSNKSTANANCTDGPPPTCRNETGLNAASAVNTLGPVTTVALVLGGAAVATGAIWLGVRGSGKRESVSVGVAPMGSGAAWRMEGSW